VKTNQGVGPETAFKKRPGLEKGGPAFQPRFPLPGVLPPQRNIGFDIRSGPIIESDGNRDPLEAISMSFQLKRAVFFCFIFYFGLGCCLGNLADAAAGSKKLHLPGVLNQYLPLLLQPRL